MLKDLFDGKTLNKSINPDEAVAYGAAVQAAIISNQAFNGSNDIMLLDVVPLSLGVKATGDLMSVVIPKNTNIPIRKSQTYRTANDDQTNVGIYIYEGERPLVKDCNQLGKFTVNNLPKAPAGAVETEVTFEIDENGILKVSAIVKANGASGQVTIKNEKGRLTDKQISDMVR